MVEKSASEQRVRFVWNERQVNTCITKQTQQQQARGGTIGAEASRELGTGGEKKEGGRVAPLGQDGSTEPQGRNVQSFRSSPPSA